MRKVVINGSTWHLRIFWALLFFKELGIRPSLLLFDRGFRSFFKP